MTKLPTPIAALATLICLAAPTGLQAQDALYDTAPPADAVFIRWLGDAAMSETARTVFNHAFAPEAAGPDYVAISAADLTGAAAGTHYAVFADASGAAQIVAEPARADRAKVHLFLASCDAVPMKLVVAGAGVEVAAVTKAQTVAMRAVNPVAASLAVEGADGAVLGQFDLTLSRGQDVTFFACKGTAEVIANTYGAVVKE